MLPDPALEDYQKKNQFVQVGNKHVLETIKKYRKRKRGNFGHFTPESRAKIAKWACEYGYTSVAKRFSKELMRNVNESTVRLIKKTVFKGTAKFREWQLYFSA